MNTGEIIETDRLLLMPGNNAKDNIPFLKMLREDGDFSIYCGLPFSKDYLFAFNNYFEKVNQCIYSIYHKEENRFIGYVGFHLEDKAYDLEFYISKGYRRRGFCAEACITVLKKIFDTGISIDGNIVTENKVTASTIEKNIATKNLLEKIGFVGCAEDMFLAFESEDEECEIHASLIKKYDLNKMEFQKQLKKISNL